MAWAVDTCKENPIPKVIFEGQIHPKLDLASSNEEAKIVIIKQAVMKGAHHIVVADDVDVFIVPMHLYHMLLGFPCILGFIGPRTNMQWQP